MVRLIVRRALLSLLAVGVAIVCGCSQLPMTNAPRATGGASELPSTSHAFPDKSNTGVPAGVELTDYKGPCAFATPGTVVEGQVITCDRVVILADNITIRSSLVRGWIDLGSESARLTLEDSEVDAGDSMTPAVGFYNLTVRRSEVRGGQTSIQCASNCLIEDSLLHDQMDPVGQQHLGGYLSNGGSDVVLRHNTVACSPADNGKGGGCTGSVQIFGDFAPLSNFRFENNLIKATPGGYCASFGYNPGANYGDRPTGIVVVGNVFERGSSGKCGVWGATTSFLEGGKENRFANNKWEDGSPLQPNS